MKAPRFVYEFIKNKRVVEIESECLYDAEVIFARRYGEWPQLVGQIVKTPHAGIPKFRFKTREGREVYISIRQGTLNRAAQAFEDRFGYRTRGEPL